MPNVTHYECTAHYLAGGGSLTKRYPFLAEHGATGPEGLPIEAAEALIAKWNARRRPNDSVRYRYRLPTEA